MEEAVTIISFMIAVGVLAGGIGYCVKQDTARESSKPVDKLRDCLKDRLGTFEQCVQLYGDDK